MAAALLTALAAGCASSAGSGPVAGGAAGSSAAPGGGGSTANGIPPRKIELGISARGRTVSVHPNDVISVRLTSTYWRFQKVSGGVLSRGTSVSMPRHGHVVAGSGAGAVVATFRALKTGTAHITAARQSCGEAMRCVGDRGTFTITVVVR